MQNRERPFENKKGGYYSLCKNLAGTFWEGNPFSPSHCISYNVIALIVKKGVTAELSVS